VKEPGSLLRNRTVYPQIYPPLRWKECTVPYGLNIFWLLIRILAFVLVIALWSPTHRVPICRVSPASRSWARTTRRYACSCLNVSEEHMPLTLAISNRLLGALAADDLDPLRPHLNAVMLSHRQALSKPGTPIEDVYFVQ